MSSKVLVMQTAFLGDCVLTLPLINALQRSGMQVDVVCKKGTEDVFRSCSGVSETITFDKKSLNKGVRGIINLSSLLKKSNYSRVFLPQRSFRSGLITYLAGIEKRTGFKRGGSKFFLTEKVPFDWDRHEVERQLDFARAIGPGASRVEFNLNPDPEKLSGWKQKLSGRGKLIGIAPQSNWQTKRWPAENFKKVAEEFSKENTVVILGSAREKWEGENIINLSGETPLKDLIAACSLLDLLVSNDCGVMHIASALGVKVVVIYGATVPGLGFTPWGVHRVVENNSLECRPCSLHGPRKCPKKHFKCMLDIKPEEVIEDARDILMENERRI